MDEHTVVIGVLRCRGRLLLCHRAPEREWYPNVWDFPGGHVEAEESPQDALRRELLEELGVVVGHVDEAPVLRVVDAAENLVLTAWVVDEWSGEVQNMQPEEHDEIQWLSSAEIEGVPLAHPSYLPLIRALLGHPG